MKKNIFAYMSMILALAILTPSCNKENEDTLPDMPPAEALMMDFSDFATMPDTSLKSLVTYQNFFHSFLTVAGWTWVNKVLLAVPAAAYIESFDQKPVYKGDNTWEWSYTQDIFEHTYTVRLITRRISNEELVAEMYLTLEGIYEDFKWFEGTLRYDRTHALWTLYDDPGHKAPIIQVEWNKDWEQDVSDITYTNIRAGDLQNGSYIAYGIVDDESFDAYYTVSVSGNTIEIQWNRTTKAGRVKDEAKYGDANWHCWNEIFQDADCS